MEVVALHRAVSDAEPEAILSFLERVFNPPERLDAPEIRDILRDTERDVHRMVRRERRPAVMRDPATRLARPTSAFPRTATAPVLQIDRELSGYTLH